MSFMDEFDQEIARYVRGSAERREARWVEEPMPLDRFLQSGEMLGRFDLSDKQHDIVRHGTRILYPETYHELGWDDSTRQVFELRLALGKGSGKNFMGRLIMAYSLHILLCMEGPREYFGMKDGDVHMLNVAPSAPSARLNFFNPLSQELQGSQWFRSRIEPKATTIELEKNLVVVSGHSRPETMEGLNPLIVVLDEIAAFRSELELKAKTQAQDRAPANSAKAMHRLALSSVRSRFPETGKVISHSFVWFKNDPIDALVREAERIQAEVGLEESRIYAMRAATWEVRPDRTEADFAPDFRDDPDDAWARYGSRPRSLKGRYFQNLPAIRAALGAPATGGSDDVAGEYRVGVEYEYVDERWECSFETSAIERHESPLAIHVDVGVVHDSCGVSASHVSGWRNIEREVDGDNGVTEMRVSREPMITTDFVIALEPQAGSDLDGIPRSDIQIRWVMDLIRQLRDDGFQIGLVTTDGYQSTQLRQDLAYEGIPTELYSMDRLKSRSPEGYDTLKDVIYSGRVSAPWSPELFAELEMLIRTATGKVDHVRGMSKDRADAWGGSVVGSITLANTAPFDPEDAWTGGSLEETAREHAQEVANTMGWMVSPASTDTDAFHEYLEHADQEMDRQRFEAASHTGDPFRSSDQPL